MSLKTAVEITGNDAESPFPSICWLLIGNPSKMASVFKEADFILYDYLMSMDNVFANMIDELEIPEDEMIELLGTSLDSR